MSFPDPAKGPVYRVFWVPGTDELRATCHCRAVRSFDDPIELWAWLLAHPIGHEPGGAETPPDGVESPAVGAEPSAVGAAAPPVGAGSGSRGPALTGAPR